MRLIDAEKAEQKFVQMAESVNPRYRECILTMALYLRNEDDIPTVDAEPIRHGHWIKRTKEHPDLPNDSTYNYECSNCSYMDTHGANVEVPYCWHCGAKMDEEEK